MKNINEKTKELMEMFHLHVEPTALLESLSIAEQSIVQIAKAVYFEPEILILDDSSSALDYATDLKLRKAIHGLWK